MKQNRDGTDRRARGSSAAMSGKCGALRELVIGTDPQYAPPRSWSYDPTDMAELDELVKSGSKVPRAVLGA